jgi:hypothetical protein
MPSVAPLLPRVRPTTAISSSQSWAGSGSVVTTEGLPRTRPATVMVDKAYSSKAIPGLAAHPRDHLRDPGQGRPESQPPQPRIGQRAPTGLRRAGQQGLQHRRTVYQQTQAVRAVAATSAKSSSRAPSTSPQSRSGFVTWFHDLRDRPASRPRAGSFRPVQPTVAGTSRPRPARVRSRSPAPWQCTLDLQGCGSSRCRWWPVGSLVGSRAFDHRFCCGSRLRMVTYRESARPVLFVGFRLGVLLPSWVVRLGSAVIRFLGTHLADRRKDHGSMGNASAR